MNSVFEFQVPWYFVFWMSLSCCGISSALLKRFLKMTRARYIAANFIVISIVIMASSIFSYSKLSKINELVGEGKTFTLKSQVARVDYFNGKDVVFVGNESFEINHHGLYCVSGKELFSKGDYISLSYVVLGRWAGFIAGNCIIELEKI